MNSNKKFFLNTAASKVSCKRNSQLQKAKLHKISEQLIMPCCKIIVPNLLSNSEIEKLKQAYLSNNIVSMQMVELFDFVTSSLKDRKFKV